MKQMNNELFLIECEDCEEEIESKSITIWDNIILCPSCVTKREKELSLRDFNEAKEEQQNEQET